MNKLGIFTAICALSLLSACGSPPNDEDLRAAMLKNMKAIGGAQGVEMFKEDLAKLKVLACKKAEPQGYLCDIKGFMGMTQSVRMIKTDDEWSVLPPGQ